MSVTLPAAEWRIALRASALRDRRSGAVSDYRRYRAPGGTYFLTLNLLERRSDLLVRQIDILREAAHATGATVCRRFPGGAARPGK